MADNSFKGGIIQPKNRQSTYKNAWLLRWKLQGVPRTCNLELIIYLAHWSKPGVHFSLAS